MTKSKSFRLPAQPCLGCGKDMSAAMSAEKDEIREPKPRDWVVCYYCMEPMTYTDDMKLRLLAPDERVQLALHLAGLTHTSH